MPTKTTASYLRARQTIKRCKSRKIKVVVVVIVVIFQISVLIKFKKKPEAPYEISSREFKLL